MRKKFTIPVKSFQAIAILFILITLVATMQAYVLQRKTAPGQKPAYTKYNNYVIFQRSHFHLLEGKNLYVEYPAEQIDLFKYSPTFAFLFGVLAWFPDWLGLSLWNLLNTLVFLLAIWYLPAPDIRKKALILLLALPDMVVSLQNSQSNVLVAGLLILSFGLFEKQRYFLATLCILATFYIKIFGIVAILLFLFYPGRMKVLFYAAVSFLLLGLLPLPVIGLEQLKSSYIQYFDLLKTDHSAFYGLSVMGWLKSWFSLDPSKIMVVGAGFLLMWFPLLRYRSLPEYRVRVLLLTAVLVWMVIFNHRAESPSFIIATSGIYIWFLSIRPRPVEIVLICLVFIFTSLSASNIFPGHIREDFLEPYVIKVVPCILVWGKIMFDLYRERIVSRNATQVSTLGQS
ncbi:MAG: glycosyltransferase family 87 protein [Bacteroidota bacterium]